MVAHTRYTVAVRTTCPSVSLTPYRRTSRLYIDVVYSLQLPLLVSVVKENAFTLYMNLIVEAAPLVACAVYIQQCIVSIVPPHIAPSL